MRELNAILTISYRDLMKFFRDPPRLIGTFIFPFIFIAILGGSLQANLGTGAGYDFLIFTFTGVFAMTLFQSSTMGVVSLIEDRENDFSQEIFVSPVSRYSIIFGKISGESLVALAQGAGIIVFGIVLGVPISWPQLLGLAAVGVVVCLFGASFGVVALANIGSQRAANQIFPFVMLPQYFLAGIFNPIQILPWYLDIASRISPMRYAVDLSRGVFYLGQRDYPQVVLDSPLFNLMIVGLLFTVFLVVGTFLFVRKERNR